MANNLLDYNAGIQNGDTCPHCGLVFEEYAAGGRCAGQAPNEPGIIECQAREIALLKGRIRALENEHLGTKDAARNALLQLSGKCTREPSPCLLTDGHSGPCVTTEAEKRFLETGHVRHG